MPDEVSKPKPKRTVVAKSPKIMRTASYVACGMTTRQIAEKMGVRMETVRRYYQEPGFRDLVATLLVREGREIMRRIYPATIRQLINLAGLEERGDGAFVADEPRDPKTAVRACATLLTHAARANIGAEADEAAPELADLTEREIGIVAISCAIQPARERPEAKGEHGDEDD